MPERHVTLLKSRSGSSVFGTECFFYPTLDKRATIYDDHEHPPFCLNKIREKSFEIVLPNGAVNWNLIRKIMEENEMAQGLIHRTADYRSVPIPGMSDRHLVNTIAYIAKGLVAATDNIAQLEQERTARGKALYGDKGIDYEQYEALVITFYHSAGPYVIEAATRGINIRPILKAALGRDCQDPEAPTIPEEPNPRASLPEGRMAELVTEVNPGWDRTGAGA